LPLEAGAGVRYVSKDGYTALHMAADKKEMGIAGLLLDAGANVHCVSKNGYTALHLAVAHGKIVFRNAQTAVNSRC
jgi:ankyrin repeat protein